MPRPVLQERLYVFARVPPTLRPLLARRVSSFGLRIEGSPIEPYMQRLYRELRRHGLKHFRPECYLTDEWHTPDYQPIIGVPFWLADRRLARIERAMRYLEDEAEIMKFLRHEAGHAFSYAYRLQPTPAWRRLFGPTRRTYIDDYPVVPESRHFVHHVAGEYAQKHPDEDFAETFAVWLNPRSNWRRWYGAWPVARKLRYVERLARRLGDQPPFRRNARQQLPVERIPLTVRQFYQREKRRNAPIIRGR